MVAGQEVRLRRHSRLGSNRDVLMHTDGGLQQLGTCRHCKTGASCPTEVVSPVQLDQEVVMVVVHPCLSLRRMRGLR